MPAEDRPSVLIVEDDPGVAILQRRRLERAAFKVTVASDVDGALAALGRGGIGIVLLDYRLGETTGLELHRRLKTSGYEVPVILVSGAMEDAAVVEALRAGVRDVIVKTTDYLDSLPEAVRGVLAQGGSPRVAAGPPRVGTQVLVVEDEPGTAALEKRRLERAGYTVRVAASAEEAVAAVRAGDVALALIDLLLPDGVSGLDLYERWQAEGLDVPAILVTGHADQAVVIRALRTGFRDFVPKSTDFVEYLGGAVDRVMAQIRVERKLAESELRLASVIGTTLDAILMCDAAGRVVLSNESAQQMFACSAAALAEQRVTALIPGLSLATTAEPGRFRERRELEALPCGTARRLPIEVSVTDVVIDQQRLFTVIARDISERRRGEEERREADRRKDEFLGMLGHELRNPLAAIMSAGEVLHQRVTDERTRKLTDVVRRQSRSLSRMVDDLLDMSRVTLGKIDLSRQPMLLGTAVAHALESVREKAESARITLTEDVDAEPVWIHGDPTRIEQVLTNLLTNAIKFTPEGGRVAVAARGDGKQAVVTVTDTGIGMPPALVPRVFDLFVQGDSTLDRARSGLGIGLALVRQIVAMHGGAVSAESAGPGRGSVFTVRIPLSAQDVRPEEEPPVSLPVPAATRRRHVLVVDDQRDVADSLAVLIEGLGHEVRAAYDATKGLALAHEAAVDVIIADIGMPGMSGYDLARSVRGDPALKHVRLIALTGYGRDEDHARVVAAGFDLHLTKPVADDALQTALNQLSTASVTPHA